MQRCLCLWLCLLLCCCLPYRQRPSRAAAVAAPATLPSAFPVLREALHEALQWRFAAASTMAADLAQQNAHAHAAQLVRGIIAYLQARWQTRQAAMARQAGQKVLGALLEQGQRQLARAPRAPHLQLILGTAAMFHALLQQQQGETLDAARLAQARAWLQQALMASEPMPDAHLGLGLAYFTDTGLPAIRPLLGDGAGRRDATEAIYHLRQAAASGQFSAEVAQTFLVRLYELEKRYPEAITLGQSLQATFPNNGYYALVVGRSQYAQGQFADCATTLGELAAAFQETDAAVLARHDRFDLYYFLGRALYETGQDAPAFAALRQALNQDPGTARDASLWAKYYLGILYERRGDLSTARQIFQTLRRGRNVEDLHEQAARRLAPLQ